MTNLDYLIVYLEVIVISVVICGCIYLYASRDLGGNREIVVFRWIVILLMIELLMDGITHTQYRGYLHLPRLVVGFMYSSYMFLLSGVLAFLWFLFAEMRIGTSFRGKNRKWLLIALIPPIIVCFMSYASIKTGWFFSLDENGIYTRGPYWFVQSVLVYVYFFITTVHAFIAARHATSKARKTDLYILSMFIIAPFIGALLQLVIGGHPFAGPSICIAILFIFLNLQGGMIYNDSLTSLNNRKRTDQYMEEVLPQASENPFYLYLLDIDKFKLINDTYGHVEGDKALKLVADVLKTSTDLYRGFVGRYGGDEFIVIIYTDYIDEPVEFMNVIEKELNKVSVQENLPYALHMSGGYVECKSSEETINDIIAKADYLLYKNKEYSLKQNA